MRKQFYTPEGIITRNLPEEDVLELAKMGDSEAKRELCKLLWPRTTNNKQRILLNAVAEGIVEIPQDAEIDTLLEMEQTLFNRIRRWLTR